MIKNKINVLKFSQISIKLIIIIEHKFEYKTKTVNPNRNIHNFINNF